LFAIVKPNGYEVLYIN